MASAVSRMRFSSMWQPNLFQLFQPIGGVGARPRGEEAVRMPTRAQPRTTRERSAPEKSARSGEEERMSGGSRLGFSSRQRRRDARENLSPPGVGGKGRQATAGA